MDTAAVDAWTRADINALASRLAGEMATVIREELDLAVPSTVEGVAETTITRPIVETI